MKKMQMILLMVLFSTISSAQFIKKVGTDQYLMDEKAYNFEELGPHFQNDPQANHNYAMSMAKRKQANTMGWLTVAAQISMMLR